MPPSPMATKGYEGESLLQTLDVRHQNVTKMTEKYYNGDIVPPSTKAQVLRAQKFSVLYFYMMNCVIFLYAFFIPLHESWPYYGGMHVKDITNNSAHLTIVGLVFTMVGVRFLVMTWTTQFYHFAIMLVCLEGSALFFTTIWWSPGMPVLIILFMSNLLNITVSQAYWKRHFLEVIRELPALVPPAPLPCKDSTLSTLSFKDLFTDFKKLWGFDVYKTDSMLYDERCGVFGARDQIAHTQGLHCAYMQATDPTGNWAMWRAEDPHMSGVSFLGLFEGWLRVFVANASFAFSGFWLGQVLFERSNGITLPLAAGSACLSALLYLTSTRWTSKRLDEALGVAVAEKEWLAFDVVRHSAQREELTDGALDSSAGVNLMDGNTQFTAQTFHLGQQNLVFMWINAAACAGFIGETWLGRIYENVAIQTRLMMEEMTATDFRHWAEAKWEVIVAGSLAKASQNFLLALMSCFYFGSMYPKNHPEAEMPVGLVATIGGACFVHSVVSLAEALYLTAHILNKNKGKSTHRAGYISEWAVGITILFLLTNLLIWLYLLPIMKRWTIPIGGCKTKGFGKVNNLLFPTACGQ